MVYLLVQTHCTNGSQMRAMQTLRWHVLVCKSPSRVTAGATPTRRCLHALRKDLQHTLDAGAAVRANSEALRQGQLPTLLAQADVVARLQDRVALLVFAQQAHGPVRATVIGGVGLRVTRSTVTGCTVRSAVPGVACFTRLVCPWPVAGCQASGPTLATRRACRLDLGLMGCWQAVRHSCSTSSTRIVS